MDGRKIKRKLTNDDDDDDDDDVRKSTGSAGKPYLNR